MSIYKKIHHLLFVVILVISLLGLTISIIRVINILLQGEGPEANGRREEEEAVRIEQSQGTQS